MFPLLCRDKLLLPYVALYGIFFLIYNVPGWRQDTRERSSSSSVKSLLVGVLTVISFLLHVIYLTVTPPKKYPFLFEAIIMIDLYFFFNIINLPCLCISVSVFIAVDCVNRNHMCLGFLIFFVLLFMLCNQEVRVCGLLKMKLKCWYLVITKTTNKKARFHYYQ